MCSGFINTDESELKSSSDVDPCKKMKYGRPRVTRKKGYRLHHIYYVNANPILCHFF